MKLRNLLFMIFAIPAFCGAENIIRTSAPIVKSLEASPPENAYGQDECNPYSVNVNSWIVFTASQEPAHERGKIHSIYYNSTSILHFSTVTSSAKEFVAGGYLYFPKSIVKTNVNYIYYSVCRKQIL